MVKFNKKLSQLEAIHQVSKPALVQADPLQISDFIHHVCENQETYGVEGWESSDNKTNFADKVFNLLESRGHTVSKNAILEGVELFKNETS